MELKRTLKTCEVCAKEFLVRNCYLKRSHRAGRFCSNPCRNVAFRGAGNPNASPYVGFGPKTRRSYAQKWSHLKIRLEALARVTTLASQSEIKCAGCSCNVYEVLQINHLKKFKTKQSGVTLWRHILRISDEELREQFDIRCELCNWQFHLQQKYPTLTYVVEWKGLKTHEPKT